MRRPSIRENRQPFADIRVAATAALTTIMGRTAIYERRMVTGPERDGRFRVIFVTGES